MLQLRYDKHCVHLAINDDFDLEKTLDCGQAFRWEKDCYNAWHGVALQHELRIEQHKDEWIFMTEPEVFDRIWRGYFDLDRDYGKIYERLKQDKVLRRALHKGRGIHILRQEPWETLCSFIISQNNNIPRIKGIINRFCTAFGEPLEEGLFTFPTEKTTATLTENDLAIIRCGFRSKYILKTAQMVANGSVNLSSLTDLPLTAAREMLKTLYGVGDKVADCTLLFGLGFTEALPKDVWIKRVLTEWYGGSFPAELNDCAGIAQQILFYYARTRAQDEL